MPVATAVHKEVWWEVRSDRRKKNVCHSFPVNAGSTVCENSIQRGQEYPHPLHLFCVRTCRPRTGLILNFFCKARESLGGRTWVCSFFRHFSRCYTLYTACYRDRLTLSPTYLSPSLVHSHCLSLGLYGFKSGFLQEPLIWSFCQQSFPILIMLTTSSLEL